MKSNNKTVLAKRQENNSSVRKALKQLLRLESKHADFIALGQVAISLVHVIHETSKHLGKTTFTRNNLFKKIGCKESTGKRALKSVLDHNIVQQKTIKKVGYKEQKERWINPQFIEDGILANLLRCLVFSISSAITCFSKNEPRILNEDNIYKISVESSQYSLHRGYPPWAKNHGTEPQQGLLSASAVEQLFSTGLGIPRCKSGGNAPIGLIQQALGGTPLGQSQEHSVLTREQKSFILNSIASSTTESLRQINAWSPAVEAVGKAIALTTAGKCDLSEFPEDALYAALDKFKSCKHVNNAYAFIRGTARNNLNGQEMDWKWKRDLMKAYKLTGHEPKMVEATKSQAQQPRENKTTPPPQQSLPPIRTIYDHPSPEALLRQARKYKAEYGDRYPNDLLHYYTLLADGTLEIRLKTLADQLAADPDSEFIDKYYPEYKSLMHYKLQHQKDNARYEVIKRA